MGEGSKKKRYRLKPLPIILILAVLIALCIGMSILLTNKYLEVPASVSNVPESKEDSSIPQQNSSELTSVHMISVGDNLIHEAIYLQAKKKAENTAYNFLPAYENVKELIASADIATINQETVMAEGRPLSGYPLFNSPQELAVFLDEFGFDIANLANNHCLDQGESGLSSTLQLWDTLEHIQRVGVYHNEEDAQNVRLIEKNGIRFAFLGATEMTNGLLLPKDSECIVMYTNEEEAIREQITKAKEMSDVVVVNIHWGQEYSTQPNQIQMDFAEKLVYWGADIIIGHHPHVLQPVTQMNRADGRQAVIAFSLGNFISAQDKGETLIGGALDIILTKDQTSGNITIESVKLLPLVTHYENNYSNVRVYPLSNYTDKLAQAHGVRQGKTSDFSLEYINKFVESIIPKEYLIS